MAGGGVLIDANNDGAMSAPTQGSKTYAVVVCVFASLGGIFFGYDQGVTGGVLVMDSFLNDFCVGYGSNTYQQCNSTAADLPENWLNFTTLFNVLYYLGCILGAYVGGVVADKFGRRMTIFSAGVLFCIGTCLLVFTVKGGHTMSLIARVIQGMGVGNSSFSLPIFGAEMAPKELRGMLSGFMQMSIVTGILLAGIINIAVQDTEQGWRTTNAVAMAFPVIVMCGIFCVPESPRWVYKHKSREAAEITLVRLRKTDDVGDELRAIGDALAEEGTHATTWGDVFHPTVRRRVYIAMALQLLQQATGINPVFVYGGQIFKDVLGDGLTSLLILQIVNFVSTIPAMYWVDRFGRRSLLLVGGAGMVLGHLVSATSFTVGCKGDTDDLQCDKSAGWVMIAATAFFIFNFAISWGPICWIYPAEIFPMRVRAMAVSLSTMTNWTMGALMIGIPKLFPYLNINGVFYLFAVLCSCAAVFVYYFCPETKNILLEDIEFLFQQHAGGDADATTVKTPVDKEI
ncbi:hypothetical protein, variant [Aphanomyces invadans]|uniref:Hexose transporter 1 n=2 Tax=Aphanomyces invadans TaxID=157072 RepID=A0A024T7T1_9STRA|nr:hypothetical protein, variant [Aphanomyces invadans]ETV90075.1 hypothetical protein, variant [Aphanomyces invadans]|eukprot:XP_008881294.1 hypothetical protein, variant [Aphanomyces invadans]